MMVLIRTDGDNSRRDSQPQFKPLTADHVFYYAFLYQSSKSRSITKIRDFVCQQAKVQGKSGPRKVIDPPSLGRRISTTSRSIRRTGKPAKTNPELRHRRTSRRPFRQGKCVCLEFDMWRFQGGNLAKHVVSV
jgi:hypothetical protein